MARTERNAADMGDGSAQAVCEPDWSEWAGPDGELGRAIRDSNAATLRSYAADPRLLDEHANHELDLSRGGYADRQIVELTQNSADQSIGTGRGSIEVILTSNRFYFADNGAAVSEDGVTSLLYTHLSPKRGDDQIGRFGLGFKSLLRTSSRIEFISKSGSFRFDAEWARKQIDEALTDFLDVRVPIMRLAESFDPRRELQGDTVINELAKKHVNIIRVALDSNAAYRLSRQISKFPVEFMLLVDHVSRIKLYDQTRDELTRIEVNKSGNLLELVHNNRRSVWRRFRAEHRLTKDAIEDRRTTDESDTVTLTWAVRIDAKSERGKFWAYFPTAMQSLVSGVLNAPWKTNEDRTNLLPGAFNDELIQAAAGLIADNIGALRTKDEPTGHLDALPPREDVGDMEQTKALRRAIYRQLHESASVPVTDGTLMRPEQVHYPPGDLMPASELAALEAYSQSRFAPSNGLHPRATKSDRWVRVEQLNDSEGRRRNAGGKGAAHPTVEQWLRLLTFGKTGHDAVEASRDAIRVASMLPANLVTPEQVGKIFLTRNGKWQTLDRVYLPPSDGNSYGEIGKVIHEGLTNDNDTLVALERLGMVAISPKERFRDELMSYLNDYRDPYTTDSDRCEQLWRVVSATPWQDVVEVVKEVDGYRSCVPVRVAKGTWRPLRDVIWPGKICDAESAPDVCVDVEFHSESENDDFEVLDSLGVWDAPRSRANLSEEPGYDEYVERNGTLHCLYREDVGAQVHYDQLDIHRAPSVGPLAVMLSLPDRIRARYTEDMLKNVDLFKKWKVRHRDSRKYQELAYDSFSLAFVKEHGVVSDGAGNVVRLANATEHLDAWLGLSGLPTWERIKEAFGFDDPPISVEDCEPIEPDEEEPLLDVWPGLRGKVRVDHNSFNVVMCSGIAVRGVRDDARLHFVDGSRVYVVRIDAATDLGSVNVALGLNLSTAELDDVLRYEDSQVEKLRREIRECVSDAERLLKAVGERNILDELPIDFRAFNLYSGNELSGIKVAESAINLWQTDALWHCRRHLAHLRPPTQWAGGSRVLEFVASLGFSPAWARERSSTLPDYEVVKGPFVLPELHDYQQRIVDELRHMLRERESGIGYRRGLVSLPTGAGKTRVAVQSVVEAIRHSDFSGDVLWVADREELCEQAIDSWQDVWRCIGPERRDLRISRLYAGRDEPLDIEGTHVVVASIQTLHARLASGEDDYPSVRNVGLVVLDEAHHAIAPTYTRLMDNLGFAPRVAGSGPVMLGLTATPYRGMNERETDRLASRFRRNRLDRTALQDVVADDPEEVIRYLQSTKMKVLARAVHEVIDGGDLRLTPEEERHSRELPWLPTSAEERLASNAERTDQILKAYQDVRESRLPERWPTLIFATSVRHAQTVAAVLCQRGIPARWVSSETSAQSRRRIVEEYRDGNIDVLVNYGVFREGFDAPKTRVVIIARPVYSPNLYFQMIGRGLRGPANGGNEDCLIMDVRDNILEYDRQLAYTDLEDFWD